MEPNPTPAAASPPSPPPSPVQQPPIADAATLAAKHGGKASRRRDGFAVGSEEARQADLARDRERKRKKALGVAVPAAAAAPPLVAAPGASQPPPPPDGVLVVPWSADILRPLFEQGVPLCESLAVKNLTAKAVKAHLAADMVREVEQGAAWNPLAKQQIVEGGAATAAKWLNTSGVSAEHADELRFFGGVLAVLAGYRTIAAKLDELAGQPARPAAASPTPHAAT